MNIYELIALHEEIQNCERTLQLDQKKADTVKRQVLQATQKIHQLAQKYETVVKEQAIVKGKRKALQKAKREIERMLVLDVTPDDVDTLKSECAAVRAQVDETRKKEKLLASMRKQLFAWRENNTLSEMISHYVQRGEEVARARSKKTELTEIKRESFSQHQHLTREIEDVSEKLHHLHQKYNEEIKKYTNSNKIVQEREREKEELTASVMNKTKRIEDLLFQKEQERWTEQMPSLEQDREKNTLELKDREGERLAREAEKEELEVRIQRFRDAVNAIAEEQPAVLKRIITSLREILETHKVDCSVFLDELEAERNIAHHVQALPSIIEFIHEVILVEDQRYFSSRV